VKKSVSLLRRTCSLYSPHFSIPKNSMLAFMRKTKPWKKKVPVAGKGGFNPF
jgi:hypothetical protein